MNAQLDQPQNKPDELTPTVEPDPKIATAEHGGEVRTAQLQPQTTDARHEDKKSHGHGEEEVIPKDLKQPGPAAIIGIGIAIVVLMIVTFLIGWIPEHHREGVAESDAKERAGAKPIVSTTRPSVPAAETQLTLPCDVRANQNTSLYSRATGFLKKWNVDIHDRVKAGDVLAEIDIPDVDAQLVASKASLDQSKAAVETSKANLDLAQKTLSRYEEARKNAPGSITQEDFDTRVSTRDQAAAALKQSEANVATAQADVVRQETLVGFEKIYAPFNGVVTFRGYDNGALINSTDQSAGKELFDIQETDPLRVFASVPQAIFDTNIHRPACRFARPKLPR